MSDFCSCGDPHTTVKAMSPPLCVNCLKEIKREGIMPENGTPQPEEQDPLIDGIMAFFEQKGLHIKTGIDDQGQWDWELMRAAAGEFARFVRVNANAVLSSEIRKRKVITPGSPKFKIPEKPQ